MANEIAEYAKNKAGNVLFIEDSNTLSGKKGYYCIGCGKEMIAKKGDKIKKHFAHSVEAIDNTRKCTFSNEKYRVLLAKEILQRTKKIKVPPLYINTLDGVFKIREAEKCVALSVRVNVSFFETTKGDILCDNRTHIDGCRCIGFADVVFFDNNKLPILLIEFNLGQNISDDRLIEIHRLGIDRVLVTLPKSSPEEIEECFEFSKSTKWLYNKFKSSYEYDSRNFTSKTIRGISDFDGFERAIYDFEESGRCRVARIKNLIRRCRKYSQRDKYRERRERVIRETEEYERNLEDTVSRTNRNLEERYKSKAAKLEARRELRKRNLEDTVSRANRSLEERYKSKVAELEARRGELNARRKEFKARREELNARRKDFKRRGNKFRFENKEFTDDEFKRTIRESFRRDNDILEVYGRREISKVERRRERATVNIRKIERETETELQQIKELEEFISRYSGGLFGEEEGTIVRETEELIGRHSKLIKQLKNDGDKLDNFINIRKSIKRLRKLKKAFEEKTYEEWIQ